jgi:hypothetical protein
VVLGPDVVVNAFAMLFHRDGLNTGEYAIIALEDTTRPLKTIELPSCFQKPIMPPLSESTMPQNNNYITITLSYYSGSFISFSLFGHFILTAVLISQRSQKVLACDIFSPFTQEREADSNGAKFQENPFEILSENGRKTLGEVIKSFSCCFPFLFSERSVDACLLFCCL